MRRLARHVIVSSRRIEDLPQRRVIEVGRIGLIGRGRFRIGCDTGVVRGAQSKVRKPAETVIARPLTEAVKVAMKLRNALDDPVETVAARCVGGCIRAIGAQDFRQKSAAERTVLGAGEAADDTGKTVNGAKTGICQGHAACKTGQGHVVPGPTVGPVHQTAQRRQPAGCGSAWKIDPHLGVIGVQK